MLYRRILKLHIIYNMICDLQRVEKPQINYSLPLCILASTIFWSICKSYALSFACSLALSQFIFLALQDRSGIDFVELVLPLLDSDFYSNSKKWGGLSRAPSMVEDAICPPHPLSHFNPRKEKAYRLFIVHFPEISFGIIFFGAFVPPFTILLLLQCQVVTWQHLWSAVSILQLSSQIFLAVIWGTEACALSIPGHSWDVCIHICGARRAHVVGMKLGSRVSVLVH